MENREKTKTKKKKKKQAKKNKRAKNKQKKQEGHDDPGHLCIISLREPDLEMIKANILTKIHDDYINK